MNPETSHYFAVNVLPNLPMILLFLASLAVILALRARSPRHGPWRWIIVVLIAMTLVVSLLTLRSAVSRTTAGPEPVSMHNGD